MKRAVIISLVCVLAFYQYSWGYQAEAQGYSGGLVDVLADIVTAPCSLLAVCLGMEGRATCTYPQKQRLNCVPVKKPCRPTTTSTTFRKVPSPTKPPKAQLPSPGVSQRPPGLPPQTSSSAPPVTTRKEVPPQREVLPGPPTGRPRLPDILPGPSEPMPETGTPKRPTPPEEQRTTTVPQEPSLGKTPGRVPLPPTPGISRTPGTSPVAPTPEVSKTPTTPKTEKPGKQPKPGKSRQWAPCGPVYLPAPCMPVHPPVPCGPQLFFR